MTVTSTAVLFPGQGAYYGQALAELREAFPEVEPLLADVAEAAGPLLGAAAVDELFGPGSHDIDHWLREAPGSLQLAIYTLSIAGYSVLRERGLRPDVLVGHSLGEISALVSARAFTVAEGARIVCHRSLVLQEAGLGKACMAAIGADAEQTQRLLDLVGDPQAAVAVENHPGQTVLSGWTETLEAVRRVAAALDIDFVTLKSPYPFHSPLLGAASKEFAARIRDIQQGLLRTPVHSPIIGRAYRDSDVLTDLLAEHFTRRVRFADALREVNAKGASVFVESGALDALSRMVRRIVGTSATALPMLLPEAGGAGCLHGALDRLAALGAVEATAPSPPHAEQALRGLLPGVPTEEFEGFWDQRNELKTFVRETYVAYAADRDGVRSGGVPQVQATTATPVAQQPVTVPGRVAAGERDGLVRQLAEAYATALEYPAEVFEADTDLEAELGVDSVKQTELLVRVGDRFGLPPGSSEVRPATYNTLGRIADLILTSGAREAVPVDAAHADDHRARAAAAARPSAEAVGEAPDRGTVLRELVSLYALALEYPAEVFEADTDLEAELGVDSVKQTELLVRVGDRFGLPPGSSEVRPAAYNTLGRIADLILTSA